MNKIGLSLLFAGAIGFSLASLRAQNAPGTPLPPAGIVPPSGASSTPPPPPPGDMMNPAGAPGPMRKHDGDGKKGGPPPLGKMEMEIREKFEALVDLTPQQLDEALQKWPRYQKMDLGERGKLLQRIQEYKDRRRRMAEGKANELGLKLTPEQFAMFEKKLWEKRMQADRQLFREMEPRRKALEQQISSQLKQEFGGLSSTTAAPTTATAAAPVKK